MSVFKSGIDIVRIMVFLRQFNTVFFIISLTYDEIYFFNGTR